jgi:hypothetical protein
MVPPILILGTRNAPTALTPGKSPRYQFGWKLGRGDVEKTKILFPCRESNSVCSVVQPVTYSLFLMSYPDPNWI